MRKISIVLCLLSAMNMQAQELFVMTEPASNASAESIGVRVGQSLLSNTKESGSVYNLAPEVTWGVNKNLMLRASAYLGNEVTGLDVNGAGLYAKYRFLSTDDLQSHFRMAAFGRYSFSKAPIHQETIDLNGSNSGVEVGVVATQLIKKVAISSSVSFAHAFNNHNYDFPVDANDQAINYTLSAGRLMHPKKYTSFKQTNINLMLELVGQTLTGSGKSYLDVVPSVQFIINSQARIDLAYKKELYSSMDRLATDGLFLKLEYTFFNVTK
ncbi:MAG TPA: hypothetical protein VLY87_02505 [Flavobacterium sp.]|nr:hypothetical protein [Flavobacterium sp.]